MRGALALAVLSLLCRCGGPVERYRVLSFFFDGVPVPPELEDERCEKVTPVAADVRAPAPVEVEANKKHPPYSDRVCAACHERPQIGGLDKPAPLCWQCHDREKLVPKNEHPPVAEGVCTKCHSPHESTEPHLFRGPTVEICGECHDVEDERHKPLQPGRRCFDCHRGHGGDSPRFLRIDQPSDAGPICRGCHFPDLDARAPLHGPTAAGQCLQCHGLHDTPGDKHLRVKGDALCFGCHEAADLRSRAAHKSLPTEGCTRCHDPHGTGKPLFLRELVK